jgi:hypothetical protein
MSSTFLVSILLRSKTSNSSLTHRSTIATPDSSAIAISTAKDVMRPSVRIVGECLFSSSQSFFPLFNRQICVSTPEETAVL